MFRGNYEYRLDGKGRLPLPPRFREVLRAGIVLSEGVDPCILVFPSPEWERQSGQMQSSPFGREKLRRRSRDFFSSCFDGELDGQGRIALPASLREYAGITDVARVVGQGTYLEIWSNEQWLSEKALIAEQRRHIAEAVEPQ